MAIFNIIAKNIYLLRNYGKVFIYDTKIYIIDLFSGMLFEDLLPYNIQLNLQKICHYICAPRMRKPDLPMRKHRRHYENKSMQYAAIFKGCKNGNF